MTTTSPLRGAFPVAALVFAVLLPAGCTVDHVAETAAYRAVLEQSIPAVPRGGPEEPLSLAEAVAATSRASEVLASQGEEYVRSVLDKDRAVAAFLPVLTFQPSFAVQDRPASPAAGTGIVVGGLPGGGPGAGAVGAPGGAGGAQIGGGNVPAGGFRADGGTLSRAEAPVVANMNVFRGLSDVASLETAAALVARSEDLMLDLQARLALDVARAYYQASLAERQVIVIRRSLAFQGSRLSDARDRFRNGLVTKLEVSQLEADEAAARVRLVRSERDAANARRLLAYLMGETSMDRPFRDDAPDLPPPEPAGAYAERALAVREDLRAAAADVEAARAGVDVAVGQYYPSVNVNLAGFLYREFYGDAAKWNALLTANLPLFAGGVIRADVRRAWSRLRTAALARSDLERSIRRDVDVAHATYLAAREAVRRLDSQVRAARDAYDQASRAYTNGLATNLDVLTAQDRLLAAELVYESGVAERSVGYFELLRAYGGIREWAAGAARRAGHT